MDNNTNISRLVASHLAEMGLTDPVMADYYLRSLFTSPKTNAIASWLSPTEAQEAARLVEIEGARLRFSRLIAA